VAKLEVLREFMEQPGREIGPKAGLSGYWLGKLQFALRND